MFSRSFLFVAAVTSIVLVACSSGDNRNGTQLVDSLEMMDPYADDEYVLPDTVNGEEVSHECAVVARSMEDLSYDLEQILTPSQLMIVKADYKSRIGLINSSIAKLESGKETAELTKRVGALSELYVQKCHQYEVDPSGVIQNLKYCISDVAKVNSKKELSSFESCRYGLLYNLDKIHYCVRDNSSQIGEIKRLAKQLDTAYRSKKDKFAKDKC